MSNRTLKIPSVLHRSGACETKPDGVMRLSICSDEPYERMDWMTGDRYMEVLDHSEKGIDISRLKNGAALLYNHDRNIMLGTLSNPTLEGGRCYVDAKMSNAPDVESYRIKVEEGILKDTSIGYAITSDGEEIGETKDGIPIYKFRFAIHEASLVTIPADTTVGVGRQRDAESTSFKEILVSSEKTIDNITEQSNKRTTPTTMADENKTEPAPKIDVIKVGQDAVATERKRVADIQNLQKHFIEKGIAGRRVDTSNLADQMIREGKSVDDFQSLVIRTELPEIKVIDTPAEIGMKKKDISNYSLIRAINGVIGSTQGKRFDGLEREVSDEVAKKHERASSGLGFFVPHDVMVGAHQRTLFATGSFTAAGAMVPVGAQGQSMIDLYRNKMHVVAMGAQVLSGLQGTLAIPRQTGGATASWLAEDATITASNQAVGQLTLTPHRLAAATAFTTQLLAQGSPDVETFVRNDLMTVLAIEKDRAALLGSGSAGEPLGIYNTPNIAATVDITATASITYAEAVQFETNVAAGNADVGSLGYITSVYIRGTARVTPKFSNTATPLWDGDMLGSYPARATNQLTATPSVIFGNWADMIIGDWVSPEIIVDPYSLSMANQVRIVVHQLTDIGIRHPKSFCFGVV